MRSALAKFLVPAIVVAAVSVALGTPSSASGSSVRLGDEILEINVRSAGCTTRADLLAKRLEVSEYAVVDGTGARRWVDSDLSRAIAPTSPGMVTVVYVHGNKIDACMTRSRSMCVYRSLVRRAPDDRPVRFIIFSWPASEVKGFLRDFRVKAVRTRPVGWQLAWVLNQMPEDTQISLLGYSYGARIVGGATHLLAGGELSGLGLDGPIGRHAPMRVAFVAAATHAQWFGPNGYHSMAMQQIEHLILLNNHLDPAMQFYRFIEKNSNPQAMGLCGPTCLGSESRHRVECYDCSNCVGRSHDLFKYLATGRTMTRVWQHLTYAD